MLPPRLSESNWEHMEVESTARVRPPGSQLWMRMESPRNVIAHGDPLTHVTLRPHRWSLLPSQALGILMSHMSLPQTRPSHPPATAGDGSCSRLGGSKEGVPGTPPSKGNSSHSGQLWAAPLFPGHSSSLSEFLLSYSVSSMVLGWLAVIPTKQTLHSQTRAQACS